MVSNAREDLPEPDRPVMTVRRSRGIVTSTLRRLCSRAPRTMSASSAITRESSLQDRGETSQPWRALDYPAAPRPTGLASSFLPLQRDPPAHADATHRRHRGHDDARLNGRGREARACAARAQTCGVRHGAAGGTITI